jgi:hypothetical protein
MGLIKLDLFDLENDVHVECESDEMTEHRLLLAYSNNCTILLLILRLIDILRLFLNSLPALVFFSDVAVVSLFRL